MMTKFTRLAIVAGALALMAAPLRLATAQDGTIGASVTIVGPNESDPGAVTTTTTTCSGGTCTKVKTIVMN
jgi:hypothetical protein